MGSLYYTFNLGRSRVRTLKGPARWNQHDVMAVSWQATVAMYMCDHVCDMSWPGEIRSKVRDHIENVNMNIRD